MPTAIRIVIGGLRLEGELSDHPIARALAALLPLEGDLRAFGDAYYVETEVDVDPGPEATIEVAPGDIAYWHPALAAMVFFGPTPETPPGSKLPVPPSEVVVIGRCLQSERLAAGRGERRVRLERA